MPVAAPCPACYTVPGPTLTPHVHAMPMRSGWWPPPSCPLFTFEGRGFFLEVGGGLGWLPHHPFSPLTTDPMVERAERQTFAPKVAGSSPTGTLCERRGEKTLSGLFCPCRPQSDGEAPLFNQKEGGQREVASGQPPEGARALAWRASPRHSKKKEKHGREGVAIHPAPYNKKKQKKTRTGGCATNLGCSKAHRHGPLPPIR